LSCDPDEDLQAGGKIYYGWCFSDLLIARAFAEQFGGEFRKSQI
jgi:hypothetical protein